MQDAYLLHSRPWRDSSLLVDLLLPDEGRVRAVARGVRGSRRRVSGHCYQAFCPLLVSFRGRTELKTLVNLEPGGASHALAGQALYAGLYANEVLLRALPEAAPCPSLFLAYETLLTDLAQSESSLEPRLRIFEMALLDDLGYGVDFFHEAQSGAPLRQDAHYIFVAQSGFIEVNPASVPGGAVPLPGSLLLRAGLGQLGEGDVQRVAKQVMRLAMRELIGDRPLHSRTLFRKSRA